MELNSMMIPKKIHYCWFGNGKKNKTFNNCYKSWKKFFPEYEIIEWNEKNFNIDENLYAKQAYQAKKYAFVSDYARLKILYEYGGIYFDTDVEVLKRIDDSVIKSGYFAKEKDNEINTGLGFCVPPKNKFIKIMLDDYENISFCNGDNSYDLTPCTKRNTASIVNAGYSISSKCENLGEIKVYNRDYFCGYDIDNNHYIISDKTYTVHHYNASWQPKNQRVKRKIKKIFSKVIGIKKYNKIRILKNKLTKGQNSE